MIGVPDFAAGLERWSSRTALISETGARVSYAELASQADAFAASLPGTIGLLAIEGAREIDVVIAYLGALRRGITVLMFDTGPKSEAMLATFSPDAILSRQKGGEFDLKTQTTFGPTPTHPDLALLLSTSGSTGSAKLVRLSAENLSANAASIVKYLGIGPEDVTITSLPLSYSFGLSILHSYLAAGASLLVSEVNLGSPKFVQLAARDRLTSLSGVPTSYRLLETSGTLEQLPRSIRTFTQAGGKMDADAVLRLNAFAQAREARFFVMYGQTEATARIAYLPPHLLQSHPDCIGCPIPGGSLRVEAENGVLSPGQTGELVFAGPNVMMGYALDRADLALDRTITSLRTGDLGVEVAPNIFRIEGRLSRFIKPHGRRVSLDELESLAEASGVRCVAAGDDLGAVVVVETANDFQAASAAFARLDLPADILQVVVRDVPLLSNGKPDYATILANARTSSVGHGGMSTIDALRAAYRNYGTDVDDETRAEDLALDSLSYINTSMAIEDILGRLPANWQRLSLGELAALANDRPGAHSRFWTRLEATCFCVLRPSLSSSLAMR